MTCRVRLPRLRPTRLATCTLGIAVLLSGCGGKSSGGGADPDPVDVPGGTIVYTAIGASDAAGVGSSLPCVPFTACPDGRGYVPVLVRALESGGRTVTLHNLGVPGTVLSPGVQALGAQYGHSVPGNFLEQELPFVARDSTLVTIFAGGNDANTIGAAVQRGAAGTDIAAFADQQARSWGADYARLVSGVRSRAPAARIVVMNLPNMALLPYMKGRSTTEKRWMQEIAVRLSREANGMASHGAIIVDLMCDGRSYDPANYSSDGFHPDDSGYAYIAGELQAAVTGSPGTPSADCSFMHGI